MKIPKWHLLITSLLLTMTMSMCKKENATDNNEYYVKYEVSSSTIYSGGKLNLSVINEKNTWQTIQIATKIPYNVTIGPVRKGFYSNLSVSKDGSPDSQLKLNVQLSVSKNGGPFSLKAINNSDSPRNTAQVSYTID